MEKFPKTVIIKQDYVDGVKVHCRDCMGIALRAIKSNSVESWEVEFCDTQGAKHTYSFDFHNLEVIA